MLILDHDSWESGKKWTLIQYTTYLTVCGRCHRGHPLHRSAYRSSKHVLLFSTTNKANQSSEICVRIYIGYRTVYVRGIDCRVSYRNYIKYVTKSLISSKIKRKGCPNVWSMCTRGPVAKDSLVRMSHFGIILPLPLGFHYFRVLPSIQRYSCTILLSGRFLALTRALACFLFIIFFSRSYCYCQAVCALILISTYSF